MMFIKKMYKESYQETNYVIIIIKTINICIQNNAKCSYSDCILFTFKYKRMCLTKPLLQLRLTLLYHNYIKRVSSIKSQIRVSYLT